MSSTAIAPPIYPAITLQSYDDRGHAVQGMTTVRYPDAADAIAYFRSILSPKAATIRVTRNGILVTEEPA